jgi:hypothetical protein
MIRRLRTAHRVIWLAGLVLLPAIVVLGLDARRPPLLSAPRPLPAAFPLAPPSAWATPAGTVMVALVRIAADSTMALEFTGALALRGPDLLFYWSPRPPPVTGIDSSDVLLGPASGQPIRRYPIPATALTRPGSVLLYSLAHQTLMGARPVTTAFAPVR